MTFRTAFAALSVAALVAPAGATAQPRILALSPHDDALYRQAFEAIDAHVVGPVVAHLRRHHPESWRVLVMPDHYTLCSTRKHDATPPPFVMGGAWVRSAVKRGFTEREAKESDLFVDPGHELMEYFLKGGLAVVKKR